MEQTTFEISGMSCGHCIKAVDEALRALDGVEVQQVSIGAATVAFDAARITRAAIATAIEDAGYDVGPTQLKRPAR
ncbi:MAG: heavy-metal-associated domain-containing protein [Gemmatimonas sp.]